MLNSIDKQIEDQKRKLFYNSKNAGNGSNGAGIKACSFTMSMSSLPAK